MTIDEEKCGWRKRMRALRLVADQKEGPNAAIALIRHVLPACEEIGVGAGTIVAGYWPIITEIDVRPLLARLDDRGIVCALPVLVGRNQPLIFRRWRPTDPVEAGDHGTAQPFATAPEVTPDVVLAPLLAVDRDGYRLGQGGGYYDRTLARLRRQGRVVAVGVGYHVQRVDILPRAADDETMDWILTEQAIERVRR
jgi:5-formyltetrahydrofolate cyclo-ligase